MVRVSRYLTMGCNMHVLSHILPWDHQTVSESWYTLTMQSSVHVVILVLSWDRQSISGSQDTLTTGVQCECAIPVLTVPGWPEYLRILRYYDKRGQFGLHMYSPWYSPGMVRVFRDLCPGVVHLISRFLCHSMPSLRTLNTCSQCK